MFVFVLFKISRIAGLESSFRGRLGHIVVFISFCNQLGDEVLRLCVRVNDAGTCFGRLRRIRRESSEFQ